MLRLGAIFIVICMVLIAGSLGAVLYLAAGLSGPEAAMVALAVLTALALYNAVTTRLRNRTDLGAQIADLSRGTADIARQVAELGRRTEALENQGSSGAERAQAVIAPFAIELSEVGTLVKQLAEQVAAHETGLTAIAAEVAQRRTEPVPDPAAAAELVEPDGTPAARASRPSGPMAASAITDAIRGALDASRVDLYLQPIVTLPQRKVRYYEALTRLRTGDGDLLQPSEFLAPAEAAGLLPRIDQLLLFRTVQVARRLLLKNRDVGLFCNISAATLNESQLFAQLMQFMEANRALAPSLVLEFKQASWRTMGPLEQESLAALRELGFRFCIDQVADLRMEPRELGERGVRFVKAPATLLLGRGPSTDIHAADLSDLLSRFGIGLIADRIESESQVVDLLDYDLRFGQGFLFSPPRPVKAEALQGAEPAANGERPRPAA